MGREAQAQEAQEAQDPRESKGIQGRLGDDPALEPGINIRVTPNGSKWYLQHMFLS